MDLEPCLDSPLPREMALMIAKLRAAPSRVAAGPGILRP